MSEEQGLTPYETREILFYKTENGEVRVEILLFQENLWLTQAKMAELFEVQKAAISKHLKNIFESGELSEDSVAVSYTHLDVYKRQIPCTRFTGARITVSQNDFFQPSNTFRFPLALI